MTISLIDPAGPWEPDPIGETRCPRCGKPVFCAWDDDMAVIPLEPDDAGGWVVSEDANNLPWCRPDDGGQLALDERLYRRHEPSCPFTAPVIPLQSARSRRRPETARRLA